MLKLTSRQLFYTLFILMTMLTACQKKRPGKPRVLVFSKTAAFYHSSIPAGNAALLKLGRENGFEVDTTTDANWFNEDTLRQYSAVVFLSTTGDVLNHYQEVAFERYIQAGGGFVGIHAASDTEYDWGWYGRLVGAYFKNHPMPQKASFRVVRKNHPATRDLPEQFSYEDEWYNFKKISGDTKVLITIDEKSYQGGENGDPHPMAWYHDYDGGRSFYTALGHSDAAFKDSLHLDHLLGGIRYAIGKNYELDYRKAKSLPVPDRERFVKTQLLQGSLFEPTEMAVLPNLDILLAQRRGELMLYSQESKTVKQAGFLSVYHQAEVPNVNAEEGFMGLALDPDFNKNNYIYAFYSPLDTSVNRLSRFVFTNDTLDMASEKIILEFFSQRNICCHTGGSIAFGKDRTLYLSTGDNSTPFDQPDPSQFKNHGFAPLDGRPGYEQYDARRSSGNTNDLRGKILRIKVLPDGSYEIPDGNLFTKGTGKTKPEIYVMGNRNPYRISVDKKTGYLYWGEVGPDANADSLDTRGPRGYDEVNQARKAGYFGWPLFVADNKPYREYDYATGQSGALFDPEKPVNHSPNNTGLTALPPAQPAFIWYPYAASPDFPQVGAGGRNAMAGPVYYTDQYPEETRYPDYYDGKLMVYDWIRGWIKAVTMLPNGDFDKMEPFMEGVKLAAPIDMEVGPDGRLYVLEYGKGWFSKNPDAGIARLDYLPEGEEKARMGPVAGNTAGPELDIWLDDTSGYYQAGQVIGYEIKVNGSTPVDTASLLVTADYVKGTDMAGTSMGHQQVSEVLLGRNQVLASDCQSCHKENEASVGPSYQQVQARYRGEQGAAEYLARKIVKGGAGVWGEVAMPAHPALKPADARQMVQWILSLGDPAGTATKPLPAKGQLLARKPAPGEEETVLRIRADYIGPGSPGNKPQQASKTVYLQLKAP